MMDIAVPDQPHRVCPSPDELAGIQASWSSTKIDPSDWTTDERKMGAETAPGGASPSLVAAAF